MNRRGLLLGTLGIAAAKSARGAAPTRDEAKAALRKAVACFHNQVAARGGYVWRVSGDLTLREGEAKTGPDTIWVQPPGTPSVGMAFLDAYEAVGDPACLQAAVEAAHALVKGQLHSGGWPYGVEFDPWPEGRGARDIPRSSGGGGPARPRRTRLPRRLGGERHARRARHGPAVRDHQLGDVRAERGCALPLSEGITPGPLRPLPRALPLRGRESSNEAGCVTRRAPPSLEGRGLGG